jgi:hypothetical protein
LWHDYIRGQTSNVVNAAIKISESSPSTQRTLQAYASQIQNPSDIFAINADAVTSLARTQLNNGVLRQFIFLLFVIIVMERLLHYFMRGPIHCPASVDCARLERAAYQSGSMHIESIGEMRRLCNALVGKY